MYVLEACMVCGEKQRTIVAEYNRLIFIDSMWQNDIARFDYALCHGCGLVYATRRPGREEYDFLYNNFHEFLVRNPEHKKFSVPEMKREHYEAIDRDFVPWWELRSHPVEGHPIRKVLQQDLANAITYAPHIMLHVPIEGAKVLHIRAKGSTLGDVLKRMLGAAQVDLITLFPDHKYLAEKNEGIRAISSLDYEDFRIPFEERYNLIIETHIFLHMLDPNQTFRTFDEHLEEDGYIFVQKELADDRLYRNRKNLFAELRPFHFQQFDVGTLERMFRRYGYRVVMLSHKDDKRSEIIGVVQHQTGEPQPCPRIEAADLKARLAMYARWRDESILSLPQDRCQVLFGEEIDPILERVRKTGGLKITKKGVPAALRHFRDAKFTPDQLAISAWVEGSPTREAVTAPQ